MKRPVKTFAAIVGTLALCTTAVGTSSATDNVAEADRPTIQKCALPTQGGEVGSAEPNQESLDPDAVNSAIAYASTHLRASVQIFRNNCRVGSGPLDPVTDKVPNNVWSSTKSVVSMLAGIAQDQGKLGLDDPIGKYLPTGAGWGDAAHRAITVRNLLTQTSGLKEAAFSELGTVGADPSTPQEALAQPLIHRPGEHFEYSQRDVDLAAYVVQRAVGDNLQTFAQRALFDPLGIPRNSYFWLRDRAGNTYGWAMLYMPPDQFAKLGLLMQNNGIWNGHRVLSSSYVRQAGKPTPTNGCYGLLFWTNVGRSCTGANVPAAQTVNHRMIPSAPKDLYAMVGFLQQNNFVIPSLNMTVTWTGALGDTTPNTSGLLSAEPRTSDLYYNFFRILMSGVKDKHIPDAVPYNPNPIDFDVNPLNYLDPTVAVTDLFPNRRCNVVICDGNAGTVQNLQDVINGVVGIVGR